MTVQGIKLDNDEMIAIDSTPTSSAILKFILPLELLSFLHQSQITVDTFSVATLCKMCTVPHTLSAQKLQLHVYLICWWCHEWRICKFCNQLISDFIVRCCALLTHLLTHLHWKMPKTLPNFLSFPSFAVNNTKCHDSFFIKTQCHIYYRHLNTHTHTVIKDL